MDELGEIIYQWIPGGGLTPEAQVELCLEAVRTAANFLEFSSVDELEAVLADIQQPLVILAAAGLLSEVSFHLHDPQGICGATATLDPYDVADFEEVDLSGLRLVANPEGCGSLRIVCLDGALVQQIVGEDWLPLSSATLECTQVNLDVSGNESDSRQEDNDEHDDDYQGWDELADDDGRLYDQLPDPSRISD